MSEDQMPAAFVAPEAADLAPLFPGYEIEGLIATGGMGAVYGAIQKSLERAVAIKILPQEFTGDAAFRSGFESEAKAMARLNHPNLIGVYDFGEVAGMLYIIMEYVPGQSLYHSAHGIAIDPSEVNRLVSGICHGLAHAHENGIIHRDIKPSNILLDLNANPKIGDFGLARPAERQIQAGEEIFGTPHYTAPEVVAAPSAVDHRADIFSVGVLLHELLTGRLPADDQRTASAISMCDPRFDAIIRRATDLMPDRRYGSALEIAADLHHIATSAGPKVLRTAAAGGQPQASPRKGKTAASARKTSTAPVVVIILIIAAIAAVALKRHSDRAKAPEITIEEVVLPAPVAPEVPTPPQPEPAVEIPTEPSTPPEPVVLPDPEPEQPEPEPEPQVIEPKSDVPAFLARARGIMRKRAEPLINSHDLNLQKNTDSWSRALRRAIRKIDLPGVRGNADVALKEFLDLHENEGNRLPALNPYLSTLPALVETHEEFIEKQKELERAVVNELSTLSATYILGIEKQIERLKAGNDPGAIVLLEKEIELVREDPEYFPELMLDPADQ